MGCAHGFRRPPCAGSQLPGACVEAKNRNQILTFFIIAIAAFLFPASHHIEENIFVAPAMAAQLYASFTMAT